MIVTYEEHPHRIEVIARHETFYQAFNALKARPDCLFIEEDSDNKDCADAYMAGGRVVSIEPASRRNI